MSQSVQIPGIGELRLETDDGIVPYRVLLLDDDDSWASSTEEILVSKGVDEIDRSRSAEDADSHIRTKKYDAVLADVMLEEAGQGHRGDLPTQGDEWILSNASELSESFKVTVTAHRESIKDEQALNDSNIKIVVKSADEELELYDELQRRVQEKKRRALDSIGQILLQILVEGKASPYVGEPASGLGKRVAEQAAATFIEWVRTRASKEQRSVWIGQRQLSLEDLIREVNNGTKLGEQVLGMFMRHMRLKIGLGNPLAMKPDSIH